MASSGDYSWNSSTYRIITGAMRLISAIQSGEAPPAEEWEDAFDALNGLITHWQASGIHVWSEVECMLFLQPGQRTYALGFGSADHACAASDWLQTYLTADTPAAGTTASLAAVSDTRNSLATGDWIGLVAQTSPSTPQSTTPETSSQQSTSPSSTSPSQQPAAPDTSSTTTQTTTTQTTQTSSDNGTSIEGCLSGSAGNWTLTDQSGKTWQLAGDTSKLSDHVGHQVRLMGSDNSSSASGSSSSPSSSSPSSSAGATGAGAASTQSTFTVNKVKMISSTCSTSK